MVSRVYYFEIHFSFVLSRNYLQLSKIVCVCVCARVRMCIGQLMKAVIIFDIISNFDLCNA